MDILDLPELGTKWDSFWVRVWVGEPNVWLFGLIIVIAIVVINIPWQKFGGAGTKEQKTDQIEALFPNMKIGELFSYVYDNSDFIGADGGLLADENWIKIGDEIRDQASVGRLTFWGRARSGKNPLTQVPKEYWKEGKFTYKFFGERDDDPPHTRPRPGNDELRDLQVNRSQVTQIWPRKRGK